VTSHQTGNILSHPEPGVLYHDVEDLYEQMSEQFGPDEAAPLIAAAVQLMWLPCVSIGRPMTLEEAQDCLDAGMAEAFTAFFGKTQLHKWHNVNVTFDAVITRYTSEHHMAC
jgi:hypothetical protein